jgi:hypothetical protein
MAIVKEWQPKSEYAKEKVDEQKMVKASITEMDWRQLKSKAILSEKTVQDLAGQIIREHIHSH